MALSDIASAIRLPAALAMARASSPFWQGCRNISCFKQGVAFHGSYVFTEHMAAPQELGGFMSRGPMFKGVLMLSQSRQRPGHERIAGDTKKSVAALLRKRKQSLGGSHGLRVFAGDVADHSKRPFVPWLPRFDCGLPGTAIFRTLVEFSGSRGVIAKTGSGNAAE